MFRPVVSSSNIINRMTETRTGVSVQEPTSDLKARTSREMREMTEMKVTVRAVLLLHSRDLHRKGFYCPLSR